MAYQELLADEHDTGPSAARPILGAGDAGLELAFQLDAWDSPLAPTVQPTLNGPIRMLSTIGAA